MYSTKYREVTEEEIGFIIRECDYRKFTEVKYNYGLTGYRVECFYEGKLSYIVIETYSHLRDRYEKKYYIEDIT